MSLNRLVFRRSRNDRLLAVVDILHLMSLDSSSQLRARCPSSPLIARLPDVCWQSSWQFPLMVGNGKGRDPEMPRTLPSPALELDPVQPPFSALV